MIEAVAERFEGAPRQFRRRWSAEFKAQAVAETIVHRIGIHPSQLFGWRRDARDGHQSLRQEPAIPAETKLSGSRAVIEVIIGDVVIRAGTEIDEAHLQRVIRAVRSA
jgi:transposase